MTEFGHVHEPVHAEFAGSRFVAVGNQLLISPPEAKWETFPDFLRAHMRRLISTKSEWWATSNHPLAELGRHTDALIAEAEAIDGLVRVAGDGGAVEFTLVAYDLYIVRHHNSFSRRVLERLRQPEQYFGARIELAAAAAFLRAGFTIVGEDERDGSRKHPEFIAEHSGSKTKIAVEAKARHRRKDDAETELGIARLVRDAALKETQEPLALFLELSAPPATSNDAFNAWTREIEKALTRAQSPGPNGEPLDRFALVVVTNRTFTPGRAPRFSSWVFQPPKPAVPISSSIAAALRAAVSQTHRVPESFED